MFRFITLLVTVLTLSGCAFIQSFSGKLPEQIDQWTATQQYGKALKTLEYVSKSNKNYALLMRKKKQVIKKAENYSRQIKNTAQLAENRRQWNKANQTYKQALENYPQGKYLNQQYQAFIKRREAYLDNLELKLAVSKGKWLLSSKPVQQTIVEANPEDRKAKRKLDKTLDQSEETATELMECAEVAIRTNRSALAQTCLKIASELGASSIDNKKLLALKAKLGKQHKQYIVQQNKKTQELINELKQGYSYDNLQRAQQHLVTINENNYQDRTSKKLARQLNRLLKKGISTRIKAGRQLYSNGKIEEALSIWLPLQSITPDNNRLNGYIKRAQRVLSKVKRLSNTPPEIKLP